MTTVDPKTLIQPKTRYQVTPETVEMGDIVSTDVGTTIMAYRRVTGLSKTRNQFGGLMALLSFEDGSAYTLLTDERLGRYEEVQTFESAVIDREGDVWLFHEGAYRLWSPKGQYFNTALYYATAAEVRLQHGCITDVTNI